MLTAKFKNNHTYLYGTDNFNLAETLDCGQAFRWSSEDGVRWHGIAFGKELTLYKEEDAVVLENTTLEEFQSVWRNYFDLDRDYKKIVTAVQGDTVLAQAVKVAAGLRILNQDPWEALCSFIISQNNNIPRIKGIITRLCENFGEKCDTLYTFPTAEKLATLTVGDLAVLRSGFRAKYLIDAANKVAGGTICLDSLRHCSYDEARLALMQIKGVGPKVADCALLFGLGHIEAFPRDVWIKRAMEVLFDGSLPACAVPYAGIIQQYIFHYARMTKLEV